MKQLIINADDFGMARSINSGIQQAYREGVVTSATLMAGGRAFDDAVVRAQESPGLGVGCHVVLVNGQPLAPAADIPSLAKMSSGQPAFRNGFLGLAAAALNGGLSDSEIEIEAAAQIRRVQSAGIRVSHLDTHKHAHVFPAIFRPLLRAARKCGVHALRNPFEPLATLSWSAMAVHPRAWKRYPAVRAMRCFARAFRRQVEAEGLVTTDGTLGITVTGCLDRKLLEAMVRRVPDGTWELICHPASDERELKGMTSLGRSGMRELQLLTSPDTRRLLDSCGVERISYADLVRERSGK